MARSEALIRAQNKDRRKKRKLVTRKKRILTDEEKAQVRARSRQRSKQHYQDNKKTYYENNKRWREEHPDQKRAIDYAWVNNNFFKAKVTQLKASAKGRGLEFDLTAEYLEEIYTDTCPVYGMKMIHSQRGKDNGVANHHNYATVDR